MQAQCLSFYCTTLLNKYSTTHSITIACYTWTPPKFFSWFISLSPSHFPSLFFPFLSCWSEYGSFILGNTTSLERSKTLRRPRPIAWYRSVPLGLSEIARQTKAMSAMGRRGMYIKETVAFAMRAAADMRQTQRWNLLWWKWTKRTRNPSCHYGYLIYWPISNDPSKSIIVERQRKSCVSEWVCAFGWFESWRRWVYIVSHQRRYGDLNMVDLCLKPFLDSLMERHFVIWWRWRRVWNVDGN